MSNKLSDGCHFLHFLLDTHPKQFDAILKTLNPHQTLLLSEIIVNLLNGYFELSDSEKKELHKFRTLLRRIAAANKGLQTKYFAKYSKPFYRIFNILKRLVKQIIK